MATASSKRRSLGLALASLAAAGGPSGWRLHSVGWAVAAATLVQAVVVVVANR
jgi:hypothetical protein